MRGESAGLRSPIRWKYDLKLRLRDTDAGDPVREPGVVLVSAIGAVRGGVRVVATGAPPCGNTPALPSPADENTYERREGVAGPLRSDDLRLCTDVAARWSGADDKGALSCAR